MTTQKAKSERRVWIRANRVLSIEIRLVKTQRKNADKSWDMTTTQDMSLGGIAFLTEREYHTGEIVEIHVTMSGILDLFKGLAKVVRVDRKDTGAYSLVAVQLIEGVDKSKSSQKNSQRKKLRSAKRI